MKKNVSLLLVICLLLLHPCIQALQIEMLMVKGGTMNYRGTSVVVNSFQITQYEISNEAYAVFLNAKQVKADGISNGKRLINNQSANLQINFKNNSWHVNEGYESFPVVMLSYYGAVSFSNWAGGRLPTEAEWLYAAGGGLHSKQYLFAGANDYDKVGWFKNNSGQRLHRSGEKAPNELGLFDMSGNVWEWCSNVSNVNDSSFCVHMGGSWYAGEQPGRLDARYGNKPTHFSNSVGFRVLFTDTILMNEKFFKNYKGKPWNNAAQQIPGKLQNEWYDLGGEGVAYHDKDSINNGSGQLNPANGTFLNEFRMNEGVDVSYTKSNGIDNSPYNIVEPEMEKLYAGWTVPGEWINYTLIVKQTGIYTLHLMYTASGDGGIILLIDGKALTKELLIPSTRNEKETIAWRQWHHWNKLDSLATVKLKKGKHVLTLKTVTNGNMNFDYMEFTLKK